MFVQADADVAGETYARFDQAFSGFVVPAHQSANSGSVPNVLLVKGALLSLGIIPLGKLDVRIAVTAR